MTDKSTSFEEIPLEEPVVKIVDETTNAKNEKDVNSAKSADVNAKENDANSVKSADANAEAGPSITSANTEDNTTKSQQCTICSNNRFNEENASIHNKRFIKPCFCNVLVHHGCLVEILQNQKKCNLCGVEYRYYKFGNWWHFICRYWYRLVTVTLFGLIFVLIGLYGIYVGYPYSSFKKSILCIVSSIALIFGLAIWILFYSYVFRLHLPTFKSRHGMTTIFDYIPDTHKKSRKATLSEYKALYGKAGNKVRFDVTAVLGHENTFSNNLASTPVESEPVKFSFDTPDGDLAKV